MLSLCACKKEKPQAIKSENISDIKLYIDDSYGGSDYLVYSIYTVTATTADIEFLYYLQNELSYGSSATASVDGKNIYSDLFAANENLYKPFDITGFKSPSFGQSIKTGESLILISAFFIPKSDFDSGKKFILTVTAKNGFEQSEETPINGMVHIDSALSLAKEIAPDTPTKEETEAIEEVAEISNELSEEINAALNGSWRYTENNVKNELIFKDGKFTHNVFDSNDKVTSAKKGTYSIRQRVILVTLSDGTLLKIPYTYNDKTLSVSPPKAAE